MKFLDIKLIGHTVYEMNGNTVFVVKPNKIQKEGRELKEILLIMGGKYQVTNMYDTTDNNGIIETNLPWSIYNNL